MRLLFVNWVVAGLIYRSCCWTPLARGVWAALRAARGRRSVNTAGNGAGALLQFDLELSLVQADNTITSNAYHYAKILARLRSRAG
jgi:hypothetical protein